MLNPAFSEELAELVGHEYVLPDHLAKIVLDKNTTFDTYEEFRLQPVYQREIWLKLRSMGLSESEWNGKRVLDVCCGTGFLSYHLLSRANPREITLNDISARELDRARHLIESSQLGLGKSSIHYLQADSVNSGLPDRSFDIIIGNSFIHHFSDVPTALREFHRLLSPRGVLVALHEPTIAAPALEYGNVVLFVKCLLEGERYINPLRFKGTGISSLDGADVWIFRKADMVNLVRKAGFGAVITKNWNFFRPFVVAKLRLHLSPSKTTLTQKEQRLLNVSVLLDSALSRFAPAAMFGSLCLLAQKTD